MSDNSRENLVTVQVAGGTLRGTFANGVHTFLGVRYGEDTAKRRFRTAAPAGPWTGIRDALAFGDQCLQPASPDMELLGSGWNAPSSSSEDCLNLNIWTTALDDGGRRPVMVNLHGGGWTVGSGNSAQRSGENFARHHDVVRVNVNHRLGVFGYSNMAALLGPHCADSGTVGIQDVVLALRWVRDNIAAFGGDAGNVTIFGVSGGGQKVSTLMAMPAAKGLFHRASIESGPMLTAIPPEHAAAAAARLVAALGIDAGEAGKILSLSGEQIMAGYMKLYPDGGLMSAGLGPVIGGPELPAHPFEPAAPELSEDIPLLIGTTATEMSIFADMLAGPAFGISWQDLAERLTRLPLPGLAVSSDRVIAQARDAMPDASPTDILLALLSEAAMRRASIVQAERSSRRPAPVYMWLLTWATPVDGGKWGSPHGLSVPLVMDTVRKAPSMFGNDLSAPLALSDIMSSVWAEFARTGIPRSSKIPAWPAYDAESRATMIFDTECRVVGDPNSGLRRLFAGAGENG